MVSRNDHHHLQETNFDGASDSALVCMLPIGHPSSLGQAGQAGESEQPGNELGFDRDMDGDASSCVTPLSAMGSLLHRIRGPRGSDRALLFPRL
jgi:hypothetical protein